MIMNPVIAGGGQSGGYDLMKPSQTVQGKYTPDGTEKAIYAESVYKGKSVQLLMDFGNRWRISLDSWNSSGYSSFDINSFDELSDLSLGDPAGVPDTGILYTAKKTVQAQTIQVYK